MKLLAIVAHPDDVSIFCGGTLAKHAERGDEVHVAHMTKGEYGGTGEQSQPELAEQRTAEAEQAAGVLDVETSFLGYRDGRLEYSLENRRNVNETIRKHQPDLLLTHAPADNHPDHRTTSRLVSDAYYQASLPMVDSNHDPVDPDNVYFFGKPTDEFDPTVYVDVSTQQDAKEEAIKCHKSQVEFLKQHGGLDRGFDDLIEQVRATARHYGRRAGCRFAEGFTCLHTDATEYLG